MSIQALRMPPLRVLDLNSSFNKGSSTHEKIIVSCDIGGGKTLLTNLHCTDPQKIIGAKN